VRTITEKSPARCVSPWLLRLFVTLTLVAAATPAAAQDTIYFPATQNVAAELVQKINAESVRIDMSVALLNDRTISQALINRHQAGVRVRLIGDAFSIFENSNATTKAEFYWLASQGLPIRLRYHPDWYPEVAHWKATIFAGQNLVAFGSTNYTVAELKPASSSNYSDGTVLFTADLELVNAFKSQFDRMWNDTARELGSRVGTPPYFLNWDNACAVDPKCADYYTQYPTRAAMTVDTSRLEGDHASPADLLWSQGAAFNNRVIQEINRADFVDLIVFRLTEPRITDAILARHAAGVPVRVIVEPNEYRNTSFPEFWLTRANIDRLYVAGVPIKRREHQGLTRMTTLTTQLYTTVASSNMTTEWQRDHNYFVSAGAKPAVYNAIRTRFNTMWNDAAGFVNFTPEAPQAPQLELPAHNAGGVSTNATLVWRRAAFATSYEIHLNGAHVANVPARLVNDPPLTYSWRPDAGFAAGTGYSWKVVSVTIANQKSESATRSFTTGSLAPVNVSCVPAPEPNPCATSTTVHFGPAGGSGSLAIAAANPGVQWLVGASPGASLTPFGPSWISVNPTSGSGSANVSYTVARNTSRQFRSATAYVKYLETNGSIADIWLTFTQDPSSLLGPPSAVAAAWNGANVLVTWNPPTEGGSALRYQIDIANNASFAGGFSVVTENATPGYLLPALREGVNYIRVSAVSEAGVGLPSETVAMSMPLTGSHPPRNVNYSSVGSAAGNSVTLTWDPAFTGGSPIGYMIEAGFAPGRNDFQVVHMSTTTTWGIDGVPNGVYYVRMYAGNQLGISGPSVEIPVYVGVPPPPAPPVGLTAQVSGSTVTLNWGLGSQPNAGPATHFILEAGYSQSSMNIGAMDGGTGTSVAVTNVPPGRYFARIRAANGTGLSAPSNTIQIVVP
jgi:hypothetical protein